jgi:hypothetical protein
MFKNLFKRETENSKNDSTSHSDDNKSLQQTLNTEKIKAIVAELNQSDDLFKECGFIMERLDIGIGLDSIITPCFKQLTILPSEQEAEMLKQAEGSSITQFVLLSLFKSSKMKSLMENSNMDFYRIEIDITSSPSVKTIFKRKELADYEIPDRAH